MERTDGPLPGVILAGGQGRRLGGRDKAFVPLAGRPLIEHVIERLAPQVSQIAINANGDPARFGSKCPVLPDSIPDRPGPLAGILAAMEWAKSLHANRVVTVATDTPFLPATLVETFREAQLSSGAQIVMAETSDGLHPVIGLWHTALSGSLRRSLKEGVRKVSDFTDANGAVGVALPDDALFNINTQDDLARAEERLASGG